MTSKKKRYAQPATASPVAAVTTSSAPTSSATTSREWVIRMVAVLVVAAGVTMALIGVTPGIAGGWGKAVLVVPGMLLATGGFIAFVETTGQARSRRAGRRRFGR